MPPLLIGGTSKQAVRRAARQGDGWLGPQRAGRLDSAGVADAVARMRAEAEVAGRDPDELRAVLRIVESAVARIMSPPRVSTRSSSTPTGPDMVTRMWSSNVWPTLPRR